MSERICFGRKMMWDCQGFRLGYTRQIDRSEGSRGSDGLGYSVSSSAEDVLYDTPKTNTVSTTASSILNCNPSFPQGNPAEINPADMAPMILLSPKVSCLIL